MFEQCRSDAGARVIGVHADGEDPTARFLTEIEGPDFTVHIADETALRLGC
jgi:hypothetical protein